MKISITLQGKPMVFEQLSNLLYNRGFLPWTSLLTKRNIRVLFQPLAEITQEFIFLWSPSHPSSSLNRHNSLTIKKKQSLLYFFECFLSFSSTRTILPIVRVRLDNESTISLLCYPLSHSQNAFCFPSSNVLHRKTNDSWNCHNRIHMHIHIYIYIYV